MNRRFQFSLRALLVALIAICLGLGGWQIYVSHFQSYVATETVKVGQPIRLRGRFSLKDGPDSTVFEVGVIPWPGSLRGASFPETRKCHAQRGRFGLYRFSEPATCLHESQWTTPGEFLLCVFLPDGRYIAGRVSVNP